jgi:hypothetical protein
MYKYVIFYRCQPQVAGASGAFGYADMFLSSKIGGVADLQAIARRLETDDPPLGAVAITGFVLVSERATPPPGGQPWA